MEVGPRATGSQGDMQTPEDQAVFLVGRLEEAGVPVARRNYAAGELVYASGDADRYLCFLLAEPGVAIGLRLTHQRLAEMVACTREAVSKEMACFEREGRIETRNSERRIVLLDRRSLDELAR